MAMNVILLLQIAVTHLLSRLKQSTIAALGVTFGIGAFIILMSFMTGLNSMLDSLILNRTPHIHLYNEIKPSEQQPLEKHPKYQNHHLKVQSIKPKYSQSRIHNGWPIIHHLRTQEQVLGVAPRVSAQAFYVSGPIELNGVINGIDPMEESRLFNFDQYIVEGDVQALTNDQNGILLGAGAAQKMSVSVGDRIQITTPKGQVIPLKIKGIFQSGVADIDHVQSYVNLKTAQRILGENEFYITDINIKLQDLNDAPALAKTYARQFNLSAIDVKQANAQFETGTSIRNMITYAVSVTLLLVAGFGIYNILNMMIYEKMNDIAILKATGFSGRDVRYIFR